MLFLNRTYSQRVVPGVIKFIFFHAQFISSKASNNQYHPVYIGFEEWHSIGRRITVDDWNDQVYKVVTSLDQILISQEYSNF